MVDPRAAISCGFSQTTEINGQLTKITNHFMYELKAKSSQFVVKLWGYTGDILEISCYHW